MNWWIHRGPFQRFKASLWRCLMYSNSWIWMINWRRGATQIHHQPNYKTSSDYATNIFRDESVNGANRTCKWACKTYHNKRFYLRHESSSQSNNNSQKTFLLLLLSKIVHQFSYFQQWQGTTMPLLKLLFRTTLSFMFSEMTWITFFLRIFSHKSVQLNKSSNC